jgi:hypothetical protein
MFKIVAPTKTLLKFINSFNLNLSEPQMRHVIQFMDALLACEGTKTIAKLNRLILDATDQSAVTDFFTYSPWSNGHLRTQVQRFLINWVAAENKSSLFQKPIYISIDDSKNEKPTSSLHFEVTDWFFNTTEGRGYFYGVCFITVHLSCGQRSTPITLRLYLRQSTVRRINRQRGKNNRIPFKSKYTIVKEILTELAPYLPKDVPVYVLFDSWYASAKLIKLCRKRGWHVICALKQNRKFTKKGTNHARQLRQHAHYTRNRDFKPIMVKSSDSSTRYWVNNQRGYLNDINDEVSIFISKPHPKDRSPQYFMTTDLSLSPSDGLSRYGRRWAVEVDHLYLKIRLGLGDFRLRYYEGITRYFDLVCLTLAYLNWRRVEESNPDLKTLSDVIALHRQDQQSTFLRYFGEQTLRLGSVDLAITDLLNKAA